MNKLLIILVYLSLIMLTSVSAFTILCIDEDDSGMKIWEKGNFTEEKRATIGQVLDNDVFDNCTLIIEDDLSEIEQCYKTFEPVIQTLNNNIDIKNKQIDEFENLKRQWWLFLGIITVIGLREIYFYYRKEK